jgi:hypothetical protein
MQRAVQRARWGNASSIYSQKKALANVAVVENQALLIILKILAHTGNANFVTVITAICVALVSRSRI